jgi:hypothetical protein
MSMSEQSSVAGDGEPARVFHVTCDCGYSERFRHRADARAVLDAHATNWDEPRCRSAALKAKHAYPKGGVDPETTLPTDMG